MSSTETRKLVGQLFVVGFHGYFVDDSITSLIRDYGAGSIVLFKRNIRDVAQLQALCLNLQRLAQNSGHNQPLFIGIDQENGLVTRVSPPHAVQMPGSMTIGATRSLDAAYAVAKSTGEILRHFGFNVNYAPVADVNSEPLNPVIGVRSFGDDPQKVAQFVRACARGLRESKIVPCAKHFPGHGDTNVDSHYGLPVINKARRELEEVELIPFQHAVADEIEMIMTAHISLPKLGDSSLPATLSSEIIGILRKDMAYDGVITSDCMEMSGVSSAYGTIEGSLKAFQAGVDLIMICHTYKSQTYSIDRICQAVDSGEISRQRLEESLNRLQTLKSRYTSWEIALQASPAEALLIENRKAKEIARETYLKAATLVRSKEGLIPLSRTARTILISPGRIMPTGGAANSGDAPQPTRVPWLSSSFKKCLESYCQKSLFIQFSDSELSDDEWRMVDEEADVVILATRNALEYPYQKALGMKLAQRQQSFHLIAIATCSPYDFLHDADIETYLTVYEPTLEAFEAGIDILYGSSIGQGKLPVAN